MAIRLFLLFFPGFTELDDINTNERINYPELVPIEGGYFLMGQEGGEADEVPVHKVKLQDFHIGKYEVTVQEYRLYCELTGAKMPKEPEWGWIDDHPIMNVTWNNAFEYINWLNLSLNENYRLPTEAEFEYVIRQGGDSAVYPWGKNIPNENIADESKVSTGWNRGIWKGYNDGYPFTSPVGTFPSNKLGVHDINGNVWEWVSDWYSEYLNKDVVDPKGPKVGTHKVGRGASYNSDPWHCRSAGRNWMEPDEVISAGFRLAKQIK